MPEFKGWPKIPRLFKPIIATEKIDGTNACIVIAPAEFGGVKSWGRKDRWLT